MVQSVTSTRFGEISYSEEDVLVFPRGIPAFEKNHNWILAGEEDNAIKWLQNIEDGDLALPVTTPDAVMPDYNAKIPEDELDAVGSKDFADLALLIVVSIPESAPWNMTANLRAPILVNLKSRKAVQVIVLNEEYPIRHVVFPDDVKEAMKVAYAAESTEGQS
jgi:flagellar assembly factor FliW